MALYLATLSLATRWGRTTQPTPLPEGYDILLTGTFYSENWLIPHLQPLAGATPCRRVRMVATLPVPSIPKVEPIYPPQWLCKLIGNVPARLMTFIWLALKDRPQIVGGFHLQLNGLLAILLARMIGARSLYICGGGEREILGGGYLTETKIFSKIGKADALIEKQLIAAVRHCDLIIVMGNKTKLFFETHKVPGSIHIMPGGFDELRFQPSNTYPATDLITVGRLSMVKRIDLLIETISLLRLSFPSLSAIIIGDGPDREALEEHAKQLGIIEQIHFIGHQDKVEEWLNKAKIFILCSDSEGVSQAMIQAMLCGLPVVVSNVGDLADVVTEGVNGFLVSERTPKNFAESISILLNSREKQTIMGQAARRTAEQYGMAASSHKWEVILTSSLHIPAKKQQNI
ncbi:MAG: glycosyltransferase [Chlorobium sp.]|nr:glycosyltransferase [Chlorobium sp.]